MAEQVLVAMSGGVDSSVAAALLLDAGHEVVGVTMRLWGGDSDTGCCSVSDVDDARRVADRLGIEHHVFNFTDDFERHVVDPYVADHAAGRTPNPCIECNRHLKFDRLLERARVLGFDKVATGHHARVVHEGGAWSLRRGVDRAKDQSYVLHMLRHDALARTVLPVGDLTKEQVRAEAASRGLRTAAKPDSQDVCFIQRSSGRHEFLRRRIPLHAAEVVDTAGEVVGRVEAIELVTVGQRRGLRLGGAASRRHVVDVDVAARRVVVGGEEELLVERQAVERLSGGLGDLDGQPVLVQSSAHGRPWPARLDVGRGDRASVVWSEPHRRVAPGQSLVLYDQADEQVLGAALAC